MQARWALIPPQSIGDQICRLCVPPGKSIIEMRGRSIVTRAQLGQTERVADKAEYRRNVGICLVNSAGLVFAARFVT